MPHKRATRRQDRALRETDLAPRIPIEHEPVPKSVSRVLDAERIRREHRKKKRRLDGVSISEEGNAQRKKTRKDEEAASPALRIMPNETVAQFNRRVESSMVPLIKTALRQSSAQARKTRRKEAAPAMLKGDKQTYGGQQTVSEESSEKNSDPPSFTIADEDTHTRNTAKEFQVVSTFAPRRLNDIAQEPPSFKKFPRGATKCPVAPLGALSMAQQATMEQERDKAIRHYRELKARKLHDSA